MSKSQRDKGIRAEREIVDRHKAINIHAERYPLSGASRFRGSGHDIDLYPFGREAAPFVAEVKARGNGSGLPYSTAPPLLCRRLRSITSMRGGSITPATASILRITSCTRTCSNTSKSSSACNTAMRGQSRTDQGHGRPEPPGGEDARDELDPVRQHDRQNAAPAQPGRREHGRDPGYRLRECRIVELGVLVSDAGSPGVA